MHTPHCVYMSICPYAFWKDWNRHFMWQWFMNLSWEKNVLLLLHFHLFRQQICRAPAVLGTGWRGTKNPTLRRDHRRSLFALRIQILFLLLSRGTSLGTLLKPFSALVPSSLNGHNNHIGLLQRTNDLYSNIIITVLCSVSMSCVSRAQFPTIELLFLNWSSNPPVSQWYL